MARFTPSGPMTGSYKKYPDVPIFYGNPKQLGLWKLHLDPKIPASSMLSSGGAR